MLLLVLKYIYMIDNLLRKLKELCFIFYILVIKLLPLIIYIYMYIYTCLYMYISFLANTYDL